MPIRNTLLLLAVSVLAATSAMQAQRLPSGVHPEAYKLVLTPDLKAATFTGDETIDVTLDAPSRSITLNAAELTFLSVTSGAQTAEVSLDPAREQATFTFPNALPAGRAALHIRYAGILNDKLRGFYLSRTARRNYAVTQFEPTDARRAYPSFDEPALKATYDITLIVDKGDTAISNTNIVSDTPGPVRGKHAIHFATTPKMSTYLVAFLVGDFKCTSGKSDGVPIRACATPDKVGLTKFAVESAEYVLHYYDTYFGIKYPMPKLDMVALPDFEAGAMENFGCITYRETDLLVDAKTGSVPSKKRVALVVAHEMAHQWFGDMVTMQWWDNIWLNEGFATWMETKPVAQWHPEWNFAEDEAQDLDDTLNLDAQKTTRTIRAHANTPDEINEMFDGIAYGKAGAVLNMVENYVGKEVFRQGVHNYLAAHLYGNATAQDFWNAQTATSHLPVDKIMSSFVTLPGVPLLTLSTRQADSVAVAQSRFFLSESGKDSTDQRWTIPVCLKTSGQPVCHLLTPEENSLSIPANAPFVFINAGDKGYYRTAYTPAQFKAIVANVETGLISRERIGLLGDRWALVRSGQGTIGDYLDLLFALRQDSTAALFDSAELQLERIDSDIATGESRAGLDAAIRRQFEPVYRVLGGPRKGESFDRQELRAKLFEILGNAGDLAVLTEAGQIAARAYPARGFPDANLDPVLTEAAIRVAAAHGDAALYDRFFAASKDSSNPDLQSQALRALARFRSPALVTRTLDYAVSGQVRNQDSWRLFASLLRQPETQDQTWDYIRHNWPKVQAQLTVSSGADVVNAAGRFCTVEKRDEVADFFAAHKVDAAQRTLAKALDSINACIQLRAEQGPNLRRWLQTQPGAERSAR